MAKCKECGVQVVWAKVQNGKLAGKKRPFEVDGADNGNWGLSDSGKRETAPWGDEVAVIVAKEYPDTVSAAEHHEVLYKNHFDSCDKSGSSGSYRPRGGPAPNVEGSLFCNVQVGNDDYSGYLTKVVTNAHPAASVDPDDVF